MRSVTKGQVEISFSSDISYLELVQDVSDHIARLVGLDAESQYWIGLSLRESVTNAIQHGNKLDPTKLVALRFEIQEERLVITVRDQGEGVNEDQLPDPLDPENLLKPGGRGIFFVRSFMDKVSFNKSAEGHEVIMEKRLNHKNQGDENDD